MNEIFDECDKQGIEVYTSNTDSLAIPTDDVSKIQQRIGTAIGELKVEHQAPEVVVIRANCYHMDDDHYKSSGIPHANIEATGDIRGWFESKLKNL
jgi:hypothetical protein